MHLSLSKIPHSNLTKKGPKQAMVWLLEYCSCKHHAVTHTNPIKLISFSSRHWFESCSHCSIWNRYPFTRWKVSECVQCEACCCSQILKMSTSWQALITFNHHIVTALSPFRLEQNNCSVGEAFMAVCSCDINTMHTVIPSGQTVMCCSLDKANKFPV